MQQKAIETIRQADKMINSCVSSNESREKAGELFMKAGYYYRIEKMWQQSAEAFDNAFKIYKKLHNDDDDHSCDIRKALDESVISYKNFSIQDAIRCLNYLIQLQLEEGQLSMLTRNEIKLAELYESNGDITLAIETYEKAVNIMGGEDQEILAEQYIIKIANLEISHNDNYIKGYEIFESIAHRNVDYQLKHYGVKNHLFDAGLCRIATDIENAKQRILDYTNIDITFDNTTEYKLLISILDAFETRDIEKFNQYIFDFDQVSKLSQLRVKILSKIKTLINETNDPS